MELRRDLVDVLTKYGVGRRDLDDPFFEEKPPPRLGTYDIDEESLCHDVVLTTCSVPGCPYTCDTLLAYESHYNSSHRYSCSQCKRVLPSPHLLDLHLQESHDSFFAVMSAKKPSYCCYIEECKDKFQNAEARFNHCVQIHKLPKDFRFEQPSKKPKAKKNKLNKNLEKMEITGNAVEKPVEENEISESVVKTSAALPKTSAALPKTSAALPKTSAALPKTFSFGHGKNKSFPKYSGKKFTESTNAATRNVNIDEVMSDLMECLPD